MGTPTVVRSVSDVCTAATACTRHSVLLVLPVFAVLTVGLQYCSYSQYPQQYRSGASTAMLSVRAQYEIYSIIRVYYEGVPDTWYAAILSVFAVHNVPGTLLGVCMRTLGV